MEKPVKAVSDIEGHELPFDFAQARFSTAFVVRRTALGMTKEGGRQEPSAQSQELRFASDIFNRLPALAGCRLGS